MPYASGKRPSRAALVLAYLIVYIIWGSTYLAIRFSVETIPPLLSGGIRFLMAGLILLAVRTAQSGYKTTIEGWKYAFAASILPFAVSYGLITTAEIIVPSSVAGLLVALEPLWFCVIGWLLFKGTKPTKLHYLGIAFGFLGVYFLVSGSRNTDFSMDPSYTFWVFMLLLSGLAWVLGAFISKNPKIHDDPFMSSGMQMFCGGIVLMVTQFVLSICTGRYPSPGAFSSRSAFALVYLIIFGSLIAYTSFLWLMRVEPANRVATHAFVNPVIAVFLGWLIGDESLHLNMLIATPLVALSVLLMVWEPRK